MHQGNLFVEADGTIAAIDFGIMGRIDRRARAWLAEILYGLTTGNYRRVAEIHFEAQYVPSYHSVDEFATALRAVGEPMRGAGQRAFGGPDARRAVRDHPRFRHADPAAPAAAAKSMVMVEGIATQLDPDINMWDTAAPFVRSWIRDELGPDPRLPIASARMPKRCCACPRWSAGSRTASRQGRRARTAATARRGTDVGTQAGHLVRRLGRLCAGLRGGRGRRLAGSLLGWWG
jgi:ubiquinone biosynthesis protein